jgi:AbrB family looped-hinge helix DNA binding protein
MDAIAEIDKSGRLVVPKKLRDALHLVAGTKLVVRQHGSGLLMKPEVKPRGLYRKDGWLVYDNGRTLPPESVDWVDEAREARADEIMRSWDNG